MQLASLGFTKLFSICLCGFLIVFPIFDLICLFIRVFNFNWQLPEGSRSDPDGQL